MLINPSDLCLLNKLHMGACRPSCHKSKVVYSVGVKTDLESVSILDSRHNLVASKIGGFLHP